MAEKIENTIAGPITLGPALSEEYLESPEFIQTLVEDLAVVAMMRFVEPQEIVDAVEAILAKGQAPFSIDDEHKE